MPFDPTTTRNMSTVSFSFYFPPSPIDLFLLDWMEIDVCAKGLKGRRRRRVHTQQRDVFSNQENPVVVPPRSTEYDIDHIKEKKRARSSHIYSAWKQIGLLLPFFLLFLLPFLWNLLSTPRSRRDTSTFIFSRWQTEMDLLILDIYFFVINNGKKKKKCFQVSFFRNIIISHKCFKLEYTKDKSRVFLIDFKLFLQKKI